jgi:hypothetical protein
LTDPAEWNAAGVSTQQAASIGTVQVLRATTYFVALLIASTAGLLAYVSSVLAFAAFGLVIAAVLVLLVHQPISRVTAVSALLVALAFIAPATLVHVTYSSAGCVDGVPCDPAPNLHWGLRFGLTALLLCAALVAAAVGLFRSSRLTHRPHHRRRSLV